MPTLQNSKVFNSSVAVNKTDREMAGAEDVIGVVGIKIRSRRECCKAFQFCNRKCANKNLMLEMALAVV